MVINLFKSTISKDLVKVAGERREKSRPMRIRFFFSPVLEAKPRLFYLIPAQCMAFHFILQSILKQNKNTSLCAQEKVLKMSVIFQTASFPHPFTQSCVLLLVGEGFETRPQVSHLTNAGMTGVALYLNHM